MVQNNMHDNVFGLCLHFKIYFMFIISHRLKLFTLIGSAFRGTNYVVFILLLSYCNLDLEERSFSPGMI